MILLYNVHFTSCKVLQLYSTIYVRTCYVCFVWTQGYNYIMHVHCTVYQENILCQIWTGIKLVYIYTEYIDGSWDFWPVFPVISWWWWWWCRALDHMVPLSLWSYSYCGGKIRIHTFIHTRIYTVHCGSLYVLPAKL